MIKLREDNEASVIYQKAVGCDYEMRVRGITGDNSAVINDIINPVDGLPKDGYTIVFDKYNTLFNTAEVLAKSTRDILGDLVDLQGDTVKVLFVYPENGMCIIEQRKVVLKTLSMIKEVADRCGHEVKVIDVVYVTNSPFIVSDITLSNLSVFVKDEKTCKVFGRYANAFAGNLYGITNSMLPEKESVVMGDVCVEVINNWIATKYKEEDFDLDSALKVCCFIDDDFLKNTVERLLRYRESY